MAVAISKFIPVVVCMCIIELYVSEVIAEDEGSVLQVSLGSRHTLTLREFAVNAALLVSSCKQTFLTPGSLGPGVFLCI